MSPLNPNPQDPQLDDRDPIWRLLAQAPPSEPDAWFTARTLARCRHEGLGGAESGMISLAGMWRWALGGGLGICLAVILLVTHIHSTPSHSMSISPNNQKNVREALEIMASLDSDSSTPSWQDSSL